MILKDTKDYLLRSPGAFSGDVCVTVRAKDTLGQVLFPFKLAEVNAAACIHR
ncbi:hypothetical protein JF544_06120 [Halobacillus kuroshimensis]|uniref:Uncharacterized protein n=1 Tax=Halobacillus kuroshimensis TaxID=302481 RepID=A0ABS3DTZ7_9BACI|nr:hypothetical protein [Halobacillus kuroshimensis]